MFVSIENLQRSTVAFVGSILATLVLVIASAPVLPVA